MNRTPVLLSAAVLLAASSPALADEGSNLISGEFDNTAHTLRAGTNQLYLGTQYYRGITEELQVGTSALGWISGANVSAEYAIMQSDENALSVSGEAAYYWSGGYLVGLKPTFTLGGQKTNRFNASLGINYSKIVIEGLGNGESLEIGGLSVPLHLSYDLVPNEKTTFRFRFESDIKSAISDTFVFKGGAAWNHGWDRYRLALGVDMTNWGLAELQDVAELLGVGENLPSVYPIPYIRMWWRF